MCTLYPISRSINGTLQLSPHFFEWRTLPSRVKDNILASMIMMMLIYFCVTVTDSTCNRKLRGNTDYLWLGGGILDQSTLVHTRNSKIITFNHPPFDCILSRFGDTMTHLIFPNLRCLVTSLRPRTIRRFIFAWWKQEIHECLVKKKRLYIFENSRNTDSDEFDHCTAIRVYWEHYAFRIWGRRKGGGGGS